MHQSRAVQLRFHTHNAAHLLVAGSLDGLQEQPTSAIIAIHTIERIDGLMCGETVTGSITARSLTGSLVHWLDHFLVLSLAG